MAHSLVSLTRAAVLILVMPTAAVAQEKSDSNWSFYGHLNLGIWSADDGFDSDTTFTENDNSNSRAGVIFTHPLSGGGEFRLHFETAFGLTGSNAISIGNSDLDLRFRRQELRKFEAIVATPNLGTFSAGQGSIATDGSGEADFSGTDVAAYSDLTDLAGSQVFRTTAGAASGFSVRSGFGSFDGGRRFRIRYDSPSFNGFGLAATAGIEILTRGDSNEYYDLGLTYDKDYGDFRLAGRLGYSVRGRAEELLVGSLAYLHKPTGINLAVGAGQQQQGDDDYVYVKAGVIRNWLDIGSTAFSVDYYDGSNFGVTGSDSQSVGLAVVQKIDQANLELFATYRMFELSDVGVGLRDLDVTLIGARWSF